MRWGGVGGRCCCGRWDSSSRFLYPKRIATGRLLVRYRMMTAVSSAVLLMAACAAQNPPDPSAAPSDPGPVIRSDGDHAVAGRVVPGDRDALMAALGVPDWDVQKAAARVLGPDPAVLDELITGLEGDQDQRRIGCALALAHSSDPRALDALADQCRKRNIAFRWQVAGALGLAGNGDAQDALLVLLKDEDWQVREMAVVALGELHDVMGIEPLFAALKADDWYARRIAAWKLSVIGDMRAMAPLVAALKNRKEGPNDERIYVAIGRLTDWKVYFGTDMTKWNQWWDENGHEYVQSP